MSKHSELEYLRIRSVIEEFHSNVFVEDVMVNNSADMRLVWMRFYRDDVSPARIQGQLKRIGKDHNLELIIFGIGKSYYVAYSPKMDEYFRVKSIKSPIPDMAELDKLRIPRHRVIPTMNSMLLESQRRDILYGDKEEDISPKPPVNKTKKHKKGNS